MKSIVYPDSDSGVSGIFSNNVDYHESVFVRRNLKPGDFVVDAGCNVGNRILALADIVGGGLLIDANPNCLSRAKKNFELNSLSLENYHFVHSAVGGENSTVMFPADTGTSCQNSISNASNVENLVEVPLVTLDTALENIGKPEISFIKTDLEGYDLDALRGARLTLLSDNIRLVLFERWATTELDEFLQFFNEIGWTVFALDKNGQPSMLPMQLSQSRNLFATPERWREKIIGSLQSTN
jgi:FkbM family methyltransferase